ncbi:MAG: 30S ribosomal protein S16 [Anaerolineae bacterium]|nr:30S ribosomal protein S16 [Anaerolineae bacterium]
MVRIRLRRVGAKGQPSYRIVVTDSRSPRDGRFIEVVGFYNPRTDPPTMEIKEDRALYWLSVGAQPSEPVERIFKKLGAFERFERLRQGESLETADVDSPKTEDQAAAEPDSEAVAEV